MTPDQPQRSGDAAEARANSDAAPNQSVETLPHRTVETRQGPARAYVCGTGERGDLVLGHGAGKGVQTPDLQGLLALAADGWRVTLVDQPWVVAGKRVASAPARLDEAWLDVIEALRQDIDLGSQRLVLGGRSAGARVACRTAAVLTADAVVALAFPLIPTQHRDNPGKWRTDEAQQVITDGRPLLVVQGRKDAFGGPDVVAEQLPGAQVVAVNGTHSFTAHPDDVVAAVGAFLRDV